MNCDNTKNLSTLFKLKIQEHPLFLFIFNKRTIYKNLQLASIFAPTLIKNSSQIETRTPPHNCKKLARKTRTLSQVYTILLSAMYIFKIKNLFKIIVRLQLSVLIGNYFQDQLYKLARIATESAKYTYPRCLLVSSRLEYSAKYGNF